MRPARPAGSRPRVTAVGALTARAVPWRLVAGAVALAVALAGCAITGEPTQPSHTTTRRLTDDALTQTFVARGENLAELRVLVSTLGTEGVDGVIRLELSGAGTTRTAFAEVDRVEGSGWLAIPFPPVADASGEAFTARLSYQGTEPVALFANTFDPYRNGELSPGGGDLAFALGHSGRLSGAVDALGRVAADFAGKAVADSAFLVVWLLVLVGLGGLLGRAVVRRRRAGSGVGGDG